MKKALGKHGVRTWTLDGKHGHIVKEGYGNIASTVADELRWAKHRAWPRRRSLSKDSRRSGSKRRERMPRRTSFLKDGPGRWSAAPLGWRHGNVQQGVTQQMLARVMRTRFYVAYKVLFSSRGPVRQDV